VANYSRKVCNEVISNILKEVISMKIKKVIWTILKIGAVGCIVSGAVMCNRKAYIKEKKRAEKFKSYYNLLCQWITKHSENKNVSEYFIENNMKNIVIYGRGMIGEMLYTELKNYNINILYFIDENSSMYIDIDNIPTKGLNELSDNEKIDAIVITPIFAYNEIYDILNEIYSNTKIISIEDIIAN
jgi:hypothetical protein